VWHECWGTLYPNGRVTLDYGSSVYGTMGELRSHVSQTGVYVFQWLENASDTLTPPEGTAVAEHAEAVAGKEGGV